jgi:hypothetical protein
LIQNKEKKSKNQGINPTAEGDTFYNYLNVTLNVKTTPEPRGNG